MSHNCTFRIQGETILDEMGPNFDYNVDPGPMKQAMFTFTDRATQMLEESVNYASLMLWLEQFSLEIGVHTIV